MPVVNCDSVVDSNLSFFINASCSVVDCVNCV